VVLADEHPSLRAGVRAVLESDGFQICAEVGDAKEAVAAAHREVPDLCLLEVSVPGGGIWAANEISKSLPDVAVVMLTAASDDASFFDAVRAGAAGYLPKDMEPARLPVALRGVLAGEAALPRQLTARLMHEFKVRGRSGRRLSLPGARSVNLTPREWDVLQELAKRRTTAEIADHLAIRPATVRGHVSTLVRRFGVRDRRALVERLQDPASADRGLKSPDDTA
jgi:DNA-binding NarL/FixJ family response regulator